jgi:hypothetical protein
MRTLTKVVTIGGAAAMWLAASSALGAQGTPAVGKGPIPPAKVDVVIERYQADKKVSSIPFSLWVTGTPPGGQARGNLRIGVDVPIGSTTETRDSNAAGSTRSDTTTTPQYRNVGTSIDCYMSMTDDGKYVLQVTLSDTSIFDPSAQRQAGLVARGLAAPSTATRTPDAAAAFRTLQFNNTLQMRDGQTAELASATDKITGEVVKAQVTLTIAK